MFIAVFYNGLECLLLILIEEISVREIEYIIDEKERRQVKPHEFVD